MSTPRPTMTPDPNRWNESRGYQLTAVAIVCPILPAILTALRIYTRLVLIRKRFWEDLSIVIALVRDSFPTRASCTGCYFSGLEVESAQQKLTDVSGVRRAPVSYQLLGCV